ncbi:T9SS type A sorting domain-containing protein [Rubricoccus marinus]|nr:T9SS type A sorting domain-containing protein [Rubricoccus marinus]
MLRAVLTVALVMAASISVGAQPPVVWGPLPSTAQTVNENAMVTALALAEAPGGGTAVYVHAGRTYRLDDDERDWTLLCRGAGCYADALLARDSVIVGGASNRASRSADYGATWDFDGIAGLEAMIWGANPGTDGALLATRVFTLWRSDDRGRTFTELGAFGGDTVDIAEVPASGALPRGRILAAAYNGVTYSDDDGRSFRPSSLYEAGALIAYSVTFAPEPGHPFGGAAYAAVAENDPAQHRRASVVHRSDDGGATWAEVHRVREGDYGLEETDRVRVRGGADGSVWASVGYTLNRPTNRSTMLVSRDGGASFEEVSAGWGGHDVNHIRISEEGRVYAATDSAVWRTTAPVIVSNGAAPREAAPEASGAALEVSPNPASGAVRIALDLGAPEDETVTVYDARGRAVWASGAGPARGGHAWEVDTSGWATGVYVVRAETEDGAVSVRLTVAR